MKVKKGWNKIRRYSLFLIVAALLASGTVSLNGVYAQNQSVAPADAIGQAPEALLYSIAFYGQIIKDLLRSKEGKIQLPEYNRQGYLEADGSISYFIIKTVNIDDVETLKEIGNKNIAYWEGRCKDQIQVYIRDANKLRSDLKEAYRSETGHPLRELEGYAWRRISIPNHFAHWRAFTKNADKIGNRNTYIKNYTRDYAHELNNMQQFDRDFLRKLESKTPSNAWGWGKEEREAYEILKKKGIGPGLYLPDRQQPGQYVGGDAFPVIDGWVVSRPPQIMEDIVFYKDHAQRLKSGDRFKEIRWCPRKALLPQGAEVVGAIGRWEPNGEPPPMEGIAAKIYGLPETKMGVLDPAFYREQYQTEQLRKRIQGIPIKSSMESQLGGVLFDKDNTYLVDQKGFVREIEKSILETRPEKESITWEFQSEGKQYKAVALPFGKKEKPGLQPLRHYYNNQQNVMVSFNGANVIAIRYLQDGHYFHILQVAEGKRIEGRSDGNLIFRVDRIILTDYKFNES